MDSPPPLLSDAPPAASSRSAALAAWIVIIACVSVVFFFRAQAPAPDALPFDEIKLLGQVAIGIQSLAAEAKQSAPPQFAQNAGQLLSIMEKSALTPADKLHVAIIAGQTTGSAQALTLLDALSAPKPPPELSTDIATLRTIYTQGVSALTPADKSRLLHDQGYFACVALIYGQPPGSPSRQSLEYAAQLKLVHLGFLFIGTMLFFAAVFVLSITAIILLALGKFRRAYVPDPAVNTAFLEGFALYLFLFLVLAFTLSALNLQRLSWEGLALLLIPIVMFWTARRGVSAPRRANGFGWHTGRGWFLEILAGLGGYFACFPILFVGFFITVQCVEASGAKPDHPLMHMLEGDRLHVLFLYGLASIFAPMLEETMFRGALFHHLRRRWGWLFSACVVSFLFAAIHPQGWSVVPALFSIAIVLAILREWRGSILAPMAAHALHNGVCLTAALVIFR
jgi:membrane protease YdiL (CAAX protease family)